MKWAKASRTEGEMRAKSGFLLLPTTINGETRWLERARWVEAFFEYPHDYMGGGDGYWVALRWDAAQAQGDRHD